MNVELKPPDPVFCKNGCWYFWDETWSDTYGPYKDEEECRNKLNGYAKENGLQ